MDEPKRFTIRWRDGMYRVSDPTLPDEVHAYRADDPAIVQALAVRKACHEAGLLDEHGNLRRIVGKPILSADGCVLLDGASVWRARYDSEDDVHYVHGFQTRIATNFHSWGIDSERDFVDRTKAESMRDTHEAAERAAKGGTNGH